MMDDNSGNSGKNPRPNLPRTRSVIGPRPLPSGHNNYQKGSRDGSYQHQKQHSTSSVPEYYSYSTPPQNSNPINFIPPERISDQPFPPLVSPKPQKPMPTVTNDITNALETQYPENLNESQYVSITSDTPKSWYQGDDEKLSLALDQNGNSPSQSNAESQSNVTKENENQKNEPIYQLQQRDLPSQDPSSPNQRQQPQQQQQMYYHNFPQHQQNYSNLQQQQYQSEDISQYQVMPSNGNFPSAYPTNTHKQSPHSSPPSSIHSTPRESFSHSQETIVQGQHIQHQMGQQFTGYGIGSHPYDQDNQTFTESFNQMNSPSASQRYPTNPLAQGQFTMAEYYRQGSAGFTTGPDGTPMPSSLSSANRGNWGQRTPSPARLQPNTNIRLLIDDKIARRMTMTSNTIANDENALQKYRDAAKKTNDPKVQVDYAKFLINMIECTLGGNKNNEQQEKHKKFAEEVSYWINLLAKKDNAEAMYIKGTWYEYGKFSKGINQDKAFRLYLSASKQDFPKAIYKVAEHHERNKDIKRAVQFYKKAASQGDVSALYRLALVYLLGDLKTEPDYSQALIYLKSAAAKANEGCPDGAYVYGMILAKEWDKAVIPDQFVAPDDYEAKECIQKAANLGYVPALYKMGHCYEYATLRCQFDPILSVSYYKRAAEKGDAEADMALSKWYLCGAEGYFDQNEALAYEHAERAAIKGLGAAEFAMGYFHEVGIHVPVNPTQANLWYTKAAEHGNGDAKQRLDKGGTITRQDHEENQNKLKNERNEENNKDCIIQ